jgi:hypothetical protein
MRDVLLVLLGSVVGAAGSFGGFLFVGQYDAKRRARHDCAVTLRDLVRHLSMITRPDSPTREDTQRLDDLVLDLALHCALAGREEQRRVRAIEAARDAYADALGLPSSESPRAAIQTAFEELGRVARESFAWMSRRARR